ncbi:MAG: hypothetical protein M1594_00090 [Candidatus Marsarchaeota archaeon]|nr:hypothetical protein [Candidatus Marsarchaeota archaeon]
MKLNESKKEKDEAKTERAEFKQGEVITGFSKSQVLLVLIASLAVGLITGYIAVKLSAPATSNYVNTVTSSGLSASDQAALQTQVQGVLGPVLSQQGGSLRVSVSNSEAPVVNLTATINGSTQSIPAFVYNNELFIATQGIPLSTNLSTAPAATQQAMPPLFNNPPKTKTINFNQVESEVVPTQGYVLPIKWGDSVKKLVDSGALNVTALSSILQQSGQPLTIEELQILNGTNNENITINSNNTLFDLYVLWGIGISDNNTIINNGPLMQNGNPNNFASTGGYLPLGNLMIGQLNLINLTTSQQSIANEAAFNSYRPCCDNPTGFPDCNHGAAALGLIELMASQGNDINSTFEAVKDFNSYQFTQQYVEEGVYFASQGADWNSVPASTVVNYNFSSATGSGYVMQYLQKYNLLSQPASSSGDASCGVGTPQTTSSSCGVSAQPTQTSSCGV